MDHVQGYKSVIELKGATERVLCRALSTTLRKTARNWYNMLPLVYSFLQVAREELYSIVRRK